MPSARTDSPIRFFYQSVSFTLKHRTRLKKFIQSIFKSEGYKLRSLNYVFCTDKALLEINRQYLKHDFYTDIITFDLSEGGAIEAEIYISIDRVKENAGSLGVPFSSELQRVMFHGALHLCGYKDKTPADQRTMRLREDHYLQKYSSLT